MAWNRIGAGLLSALGLTVGCKAPAESAPPPTSGAASVAASAGPGAAASQAAEAPTFTLKVTPEAAKAGAPTTALVEVLPQPGYKMNLDFPARLRITEPGTAQPAKAELGKDDAELSEKALRFKVAYTAPAAGELAVAGLADFSVCNENACKLVRGEKVAWSVVVAD